MEKQENGHKWSWKILEKAYKKVLEGHGKPLSVFCTHPVWGMLHIYSRLLERLTEAGANLCR